MDTKKDTKAALSGLNHALRGLHQALVKIERSKYEKEWGQVDAGQLLQLLTRHPQFEWLHTLSEFMVGVDELLDEEDISDDCRRHVFGQASNLISPSTSADVSPFSRRYVELLQEDPHLVMSHAAVRKALEGK